MEVSETLFELEARRFELERQVAALRGELKQLNAGILAIKQILPADGSDGDHANGTRTSAIVEAITATGKWMTHIEIVRSVIPGLGRGFKSERHTCRTQIGQLVKSGRLRQEGPLVGLPHWDAPTISSLGTDVPSGRNGRASHIRAVLADSPKPLHLSEICAELSRRGLDGDSRCVHGALDAMMKAMRQKVRRVAPATYELVAQSTD